MYLLHGTTTDDASHLTATLLHQLRLEIFHHGYMTNSVVVLQESNSEVIVNIKYGPRVT